ncbi:hypothetical protein CYMTET_57022 [Cymbomonas tetramitiformis]|uniref:Uncharacterized protein n=1 Tax=Cymbomonas tetramitiformis TaxID=36881 RepID=A0AAE0B9P1_9CHLO|nr:hypothetical protein CYMTET_57022 [Cymbomonas tetramitiformis]
MADQGSSEGGERAESRPPQRSDATCETNSGMEALLAQQTALLNTTMQQMKYLDSRVEAAEELAAKVGSQGGGSAQSGDAELDALRLLPLCPRPLIIHARRDRVLREHDELNHDEKDPPSMEDLGERVHTAHNTFKKGPPSMEDLGERVHTAHNTFKKDPPRRFHTPLTFKKDRPSPPSMEDLGERVYTAHNTFKKGPPSMEDLGERVHSAHNAFKKGPPSMEDLGERVHTAHNTFKKGPPSMEDLGERVHTAHNTFKKDPPSMEDLGERVHTAHNTFKKDPPSMEDLGERVHTAHNTFKKGPPSMEDLGERVHTAHNTFKKDPPSVDQQRSQDALGRQVELTLASGENRERHTRKLFELKRAYQLLVQQLVRLQQAMELLLVENPGAEVIPTH